MKQLINKLKTIFSILGGILILIQVYSWVTQAKTNISATIDQMDYVLPSEMIDHFSYENSRNNIDTLFQLFQKQSGVELSYNSKKDLQRFITKKFYIDDLYNFSLMSKTLVILKITNSGDKEIQDIQVLSPKK